MAPPSANVADFVRRAVERLPGVVYRLDIASDEQRNIHRRPDVGDSDVAELQRELLGLGASALVMRARAERWFVLAPASSRAEMATLLERFGRIDPIAIGSEVSGTSQGRTILARDLAPSAMMRALRCLFATVETPSELESVVAGMGEKDDDLPVQRLLALSDIPSMERRPWSYLSRYPARAPTCPFCERRAVDGKHAPGPSTEIRTCTGCGADIAIRGIIRPLGGSFDPASRPFDLTEVEVFERSEHFPALGYRLEAPVSHYRISIGFEQDRRVLLSLLHDDVPPGHPTLEERPPWDLPLVAVRSTHAGGAPVLVELLPRGIPSTLFDSTGTLPPFVASIAQQFAKAHEAGRTVGELHPALMFVDENAELVACAQRPLRADRALSLGNAATTSGMAPLLWVRHWTPKKLRDQAEDASDDIFRLASLIWAWRRGSSAFGEGELDRFRNTLMGATVAPPADDFDRLLLRGMNLAPSERPTARELVTALHALGARWHLALAG